MSLDVRSKTTQYGIPERTRIFKHQFYVIDGDDLSLSLTNIHVSVHAEHFADLGCDLPILSFELGQILLEPLLRPLGGVLANPVPIVGVVESHCDASGRSDRLAKRSIR